MPAGHPVVSRSTRANQMVHEGLARASKVVKKDEPEAPLAGSLRDRMSRSDL